VPQHLDDEKEDIEVNCGPVLHAAFIAVFDASMKTLSTASGSVSSMYQTRACVSVTYNIFHTME